MTNDNVSVKALKENVYLQSNLELSKLLISNGNHSDQLWNFWTVGLNVQTAVWTLKETLLNRAWEDKRYAMIIESVIESPSTTC